MHELSLCQSLIDLLEAERAAHGFERIARVRLGIGAWSDVEPQALRFGFEAAARGTVAEHAVLELDIEPARVWCLDCAESQTVARRGDPCPFCGGARLIVQSGTDMRLTELEVH